jgi:hypothetical protein
VGPDPMSSATRFRAASISSVAPDLRDLVGSSTQVKECTMGKTGRKRRARKKKSANHGKRPNA